MREATYFVSSSHLENNTLYISHNLYLIAINKDSENREMSVEKSKCRSSKMFAQPAAKNVGRKIGEAALGEN
jgi:hypothetical protein